MSIDDIFKYFVASIVSITLIVLLSRIILIQVIPISEKLGYDLFAASFYPDKLQYCLYKYYKSQNNGKYNNYPASLLLFYMPSQEEMLNINNNKELSDNLYKCFNILAGQYYVHIDRIEYKDKAYDYYSLIRYSSGPLFVGVNLHNVSSKDEGSYVLNIYDKAVDNNLALSYSISSFLVAIGTTSFFGPGLFVSILKSGYTLIKSAIRGIKKAIGLIKHDILGDCDKYSDRNKDIHNKAVSFSLSKGVIVSDINNNPYILETYMLGKYTKVPKCLRVIAKGADLQLIGNEFVKELPCHCDYYISRWYYCQYCCSDNSNNDDCDYCKDIKSPEDVITKDDCGCKG